MQIDMLEKSKARVSAAQDALDQALLNGADTSPARQFLASAMDEVSRIEAAEAGKIETASANNQQDLQARADELVEKARRELEAEVRDLGFNDLPPFEISTGAATAYLQAGDRAHAELLEEQADRQFRAGIQAQIADKADQRQALIQRRMAGHQSPDDAAVLALIDADMGGLRDLLDRRELPKATQAALWAADAGRAWKAAVGAARVRVLDTLTQQAEGRLIAVARARLVPCGGVYAHRYAPSVALRRVVEGRAF